MCGFLVMSGWSGGCEKGRILTGSPLAACLLESMETDPIGFLLVFFTGVKNIRPTHVGTTAHAFGFVWPTYRVNRCG